MTIHNSRISIIILLIVILLASCQPRSSSPDGAPPAAATQTSKRTPPALPGIYQSRYLNPLDTPRSYLQDPCQYLLFKWDPNKAAPGTVVMIVMLRNIEKGIPASPNDINVNDFSRIMEQLKAQGFEAIDTRQLTNFLEKNVKIPARSVALIQDGQYPAENFDTNFRSYWNEWGWPVINAWPSQADTSETLWQENIALENEGWVDHQSQGVTIGVQLGDESSDVVINRELKGSLTAFDERFGKTPAAIIWPGGGFGIHPVEVARELGYRLGFTMNSRGPVMFNWAPQADAVDAQRPAYIPEGAVNDPMMTLPRYWPNEVLASLDSVRVMGKEAAALAEKNKAVELKYYNIVCAPTYGPIPPQK